MLVTHHTLAILVLRFSNQVTKSIAAGKLSYNFLNHNITTNPHNVSKTGFDSDSNPRL